VPEGLQPESNIQDVLFGILTKADEALVGTPKGVKISGQVVTMIPSGLHPYDWTDMVRRVWLGTWLIC
jgi:hypothetical protein